MAVDGREARVFQRCLARSGMDAAAAEEEENGEEREGRWGRWAKGDLDGVGLYLVVLMMHRVCCLEDETTMNEREGSLEVRRRVGEPVSIISKALAIPSCRLTDSCKRRRSAMSRNRCEKAKK